MHTTYYAHRRGGRGAGSRWLAGVLGAGFRGWSCTTAATRGWGRFFNPGA
jgi:hypothetical protein